MKTPTKQDYADALSLACRYLLNAYGEEECRRDVVRLRAGLLGRVYPHEALLADELEKRAEQQRVPSRPSERGATHREVQPQ